MATLNNTVLDGMRRMFASTQVQSITATYDGTDGELTMTWSNPDGTYVAPFTYTGRSTQELEDLLRKIGGRLYAEYASENGFYGNERQDWVDSITDA